MNKNSKKFPCLMLCDFSDKTGLYFSNRSRFANFKKCLSDVYRFNTIFDTCYGSDLLFDKAIAHACDRYFAEYPEDEKRCVDNILYL